MYFLYVYLQCFSWISCSAKPKVCFTRNLPSTFWNYISSKIFFFLIHNNKVNKSRPVVVALQISRLIVIWQREILTGNHFIVRTNRRRWYEDTFTFITGIWSETEIQYSVWRVMKANLAEHFSENLWSSSRNLLFLLKKLTTNLLKSNFLSPI